MAEETSWTEIIQTVSAVGGVVLAVLFGLWKFRIINRLFGPKLGLEIHEPMGHEMDKHLEENKLGYVVKVKNNPKKNIAKNARLRLVSLQQDFSDGSRDVIALPTPVSLPVTESGQTRVDIKLYDVFTLGFVEPFNDGCFSFAGEPDMLPVGFEIEPRTNAKIGLEIQADNFSPFKTEYLMLTWRDNKRTPDSPWYAVPVLSLANG